MKPEAITRVSLILLLCAGIIRTASGQASLSVDRTQALIGDQLELTLQINAPSSVQWINQQVVPADTVAAIDVQNESEPASSSQGGYTQIVKKWTIAVFDTGVVRIPPLPVILQDGATADTQYTNDIPLLISGVTDSLGLAPIKPILREPAKLSDYLVYIVGFIAFCLIVAGLVWWSKRKPKEQEIVEVRDEKPAHAIALDQLDQLESAKLWQQGQIKEYHSRLHAILRGYLERRYGIRAMESTTGEILSQMRSQQIPDPLINTVREVMEAEDLIKFAKAEPPVDVHAQYLDVARNFVMQTKISSITKEGDV